MYDTDEEVIYLSGPMTGIPDFNYPLFNRVATGLRQQGYKVLSPAEIDDGAQINKTCYHCDLPIILDTRVNTYTHTSLSDYADWLAGNEKRTEHAARYGPLCVECGRDNVNGTHDALQSAGHLSHKFTTEKPWQYYMTQAITMQMQATAWAGLPQWFNSKGAKREFDLAVDLKHGLYVVKFEYTPGVKETDFYLEELV